MEVTPERMHQVAGCGYISVARILFSLDEPPSLIYDVQVLLTSIKTGSVTNLDQFISVCSKISNSAQYKFCPGLDVKLYYDTYFATIHYHIKSVQVKTNAKMVSLATISSLLMVDNCRKWKAQ